MLSPPKPLDEIQPNLVCGLLTCIGRATSNLFLAPTPGALSRGQISYNFNYKVNFKDVYTKLVCVLTNERYKTYQTGFLRWDFGALGCPGGQKNSNMVMWYIKSTGMTSRTEYKYNFHLMVKLVTLG